MAISFTQTDDNTIHCPVCNAADTCGNSECIEGGTAGSTEQTVTMEGGASNRTGINFEIDITTETTPNGSYTVRLNVTTANTDLTWTRTTFRVLNGSCVVQGSVETIDHADQSLTTTGVKSVTMSPSTLPALASGYRLQINPNFTNAQPHMDEDFGFTPDQDIDTPLVGDANLDFSPTAGSLAITQVQPTLNQTEDIPLQPAAASLAITPVQPTLSIQTNLQPAAASLAITQVQPTLLQTFDIPLDPAAGSLVLTPEQPTLDVTLDIPLQPAAAGLSITPEQPALNISADLTFQPAAASLAITPVQPTLDQTLNIVLQPAAAGLSITPEQPTLLQTFDIFLQPAAASLVITPEQPQLQSGGDLQFIPAAGSLSITPEQPVLLITADIPLQPADGSLVLTPEQPTLNVTASIPLQPAAAGLAITPEQPTLQVTAADFNFQPAAANLNIVPEQPTLEISVAEEYHAGGDKKRKRWPPSREFRSELPKPPKQKPRKQTRRRLQESTILEDRPNVFLDLIGGLLPPVEIPVALPPKPKIADRLYPFTPELQQGISDDLAAGDRAAIDQMAAQQRLTDMDQEAEDYAARRTETENRKQQEEAMAAMLLLLAA